MFDWIERHGVLMGLVVWPLLSAALTALFKPRTPEDYQAMSPRLAAALKFIGSIGVDVPNLLDAIKQYVGNYSKSAGLYRNERNAATVPPKRYTEPLPSEPPSDRTLEEQALNRQLEAIRRLDREAETKPELPRDTPTPTPTKVLDSPLK